MRKFLFAAVLALGFQVAAQENSNSVKSSKPVTNKGWYIGGQLGYTYNNLTTSTGYRAFTEYRGGHGYSIGFPVGYMVNDWFAVQVEPSAIAKSYCLVRTGAYENIYQNWRNTYLQIPISAKFSFGGKKLKGFVNLGGYMGVWLKSYTWGQMEESTLSIENNWESYYYKYKENSEFDKKRDNRFECGIFAGLGLQYDFGKWILFAQGRYYYSLMDMQKNYMLEQIPRYNNTFVLEIGAIIKIGGRK